MVRYSWTSVSCIQEVMIVCLYIGFVDDRKVGQAHLSILCFGEHLLVCRHIAYLLKELVQFLVSIYLVVLIL